MESMLSTPTAAAHWRCYSDANNVVLAATLFASIPVSRFPCRSFPAHTPLIAGESTSYRGTLGQPPKESDFPHHAGNNHTPITSPHSRASGHRHGEISAGSLTRHGIESLICFYPSE